MEEREKRLRRLKIRSWRRGMKEMDLILGSFWDDMGASLDPPTLKLYEEMLSENDQELYKWVSGQAETPDRFAALIGQIADH